MQEADVLVVGEVVLVEGEVVDVGQVHDLGHDVVETLKQEESSWLQSWLELDDKERNNVDNFFFILSVGGDLIEIRDLPLL